MSEQPLSVSADAFFALHEVTRWEDAVRRAEQGETIAVIAHGEHVADVVPSGELERLRETIEVLANLESRQALEDTDDVVIGVDAIRALVAERIAHDST